MKKEFVGEEEEGVSWLVEEREREREKERKKEREKERERKKERKKERKREWMKERKSWLVEEKDYTWWRKEHDDLQQRK